MTMSVIAVTGATGAQGGSVVRFLLKHGGFRIRALTRNIDSDAAKALKSKGVEVVMADYDNSESLERAFDGVYGVFAMTNFWDPDVLSEEKEFKHGKNLVDAAKSAGVKHFIFSTLEEWHAPPVQHCNSKFRINSYLIKSGLPRTSLYTGLYYENFANLFPAKDAFAIKPNSENPGSYTANWPFLWTDGLIPGFSVAETGAYVLGIIRDPLRWIGKDVKIVTEIFTPRQFVEMVREVSGKEVILKETAYEDFSTSSDDGLFATGFRGNMEFCYKTDGLMGRKPDEIQASKQLYPEASSLRKFVERNVDQIIIA